MGSSYPPTMPGYASFLYVPLFLSHLIAHLPQVVSLCQPVRTNSSTLSPRIQTPHDVYPIPFSHHSQPSPTIPGSYSQPQVIHIIHHSVHYSKHDPKKQPKHRSGSVERAKHSPHPHSQKLSHSHSTSQLNALSTAALPPGPVIKQTSPSTRS